MINSWGDWHPKHLGLIVANDMHVTKYHMYP